MSNSRAMKGDYIGFTFGDIHSSKLGLMRVSDGSRYNSDLLPPLEDKVGQIAGRDGEVLFGTTYKAKEIKVPVAFDNLTEDGFRELTQLLADKKPKTLWFDESPYKEWVVKSANVQDFKWVCFDESHNGKEKRIYKGEGTLVFKCRSPYAQSRVNYLDDAVPYVYVKEGHRIIKKQCGPFKIIKFTFLNNNNITKERLKGEYSLDKQGNVEDNSFKDQEGNIFRPFSYEWHTSLRTFATKNENCYVLGTLLAEPYNPYFFYNTEDTHCKIYQTNLLNLPSDSQEIQVKDPFTEEVSTVTFEPYSNTIFKISGVNEPVLLLNNMGKPFYWNGEEYSVLEKTIVVFVRYLHFDEKTPITLEDNYNFEEWENASGLEAKKDYDLLLDKDDGYCSIKTYNAGDIETDFKMIFKNEYGASLLQLLKNEQSVFQAIIPATSSSYFEIDSKLRLIKGLDNNKKPDGIIYNQYIKEGDFFKLPTGITELTFNKNGAITFDSIEHKHYYYI